MLEKSGKSVSQKKWNHGYGCTKLLDFPQYIQVMGEKLQ